MPTAKKFSSFVRPGVFPVNAKFLRSSTAFSSDDFPTFDRPKNATSGTPWRGNCSALLAVVRNSAREIVKRSGSEFAMA